MLISIMEGGDRECAAFHWRLYCKKDCGKGTRSCVVLKFAAIIRLCLIDVEHYGCHMVSPSGSLATCMHVRQKQQLSSSIFCKDNIVREIHQGVDHMEGAAWKGALHPCGTASKLSSTVFKNTETECLPK